VRGRILTQMWAIASVYVPRNDQTALKRCLQRFGAASFTGFKCFYRPWIARTTAQVRTEPAIIMTSGFAIAIPADRRKQGHIPPKCVLGVSVAALRLAELGAVGEPQGGLAAPDLFGSKADIAVRLRNVRLTPESGHWVTAFGCPLSAQEIRPEDGTDR
jgi:hypothetical protein